MTVFARDSNLALIFNGACSAAVRLISKRTSLSSGKKPIIPPLLQKMFRLPTVSAGLPFRSPSVALVNLLSAVAINKTWQPGISCASLKGQHPDRPSESGSAFPQNDGPAVCGHPFLPQEGRAHRRPNLNPSTGRNLFVFSVLARCGSPENFLN